MSTATFTSKPVAGITPADTHATGRSVKKHISVYMAGRRTSS
jgi:hypothetical protein